MKLQALCRRTTWEIVRDPLNLAFGLGFPLVLLLLLISGDCKNGSNTALTTMLIYLFL